MVVAVVRAADAVVRAAVPRVATAGLPQLPRLRPLLPRKPAPEPSIRSTCNAEPKTELNTTNDTPAALRQSRRAKP